MRNVILLAENNLEFREVWGRILSSEGYEVKCASNVQEARAKLQELGIDLAILDMRLEEDDDSTDISGLEIAMDKTFRHIPKIVLTGFPISPENLRNLLGFNVDELPASIEFIDKTEQKLDKVLIAAIRHALEIWPHLRISSAKVTMQIRNDHQVIRQQANRNYHTAFIVSIFGFVIICVGILLAWLDRLAVGVVGTMSGLVLEALGFLFFTRMDHANVRMDSYHTELVQTYWLELLLAVSEQLPAEKQILSKEQIINAAIESWFTKRADTSKTPVIAPQTMKSREG